MAWNDPWAIDGLSISALEARRLQSALLAHDADAVSARAGVLNGLAVSVAGLTVTVAAGSAVVTPSVGSNGSYIGVNDAAATLTAAAQDATYARIDRVVLRCYDNAVDGSGQTKLAAEIITGTPAAAPVAPTLPSGRLEIAQLQVPKSGAGSITVVDKRTWTAPIGGPLQVASVGDLPSGANLRPGIVAVIGTGSDYREWVWNGAAWTLHGSRTMGRSILGADTPLGAAWATLLSTAPTMVAGAAVLTATGWLGNGDSGAQRTAVVQLTRDGADVGIPHNYVLPYVAGATVGQSIAITVEIPAETAGSHTYGLKVLASTASAVVVRSGTRIAITQGDLGLG